MPRIFAVHKVADFDAWKPHYEGDVERRANAGLHDVAVFRQVGEENNVLMVWDADSVEGLQAMLSDPALAEKMQAAGVVSKPEAWSGTALE